MSDESGNTSGQTPPPAGPPPGGYPPNWGNAYPPQGHPPSGYPPPGYGQPYPYRPAPPQHPRAILAMVLGIVGLTGFFCYITFFAAPFAWIIGHKAVKEIDANPTAYTGRGEANAGKIMGIIGTAFLILGLIVLAIIIVVAVNGGFDDSYDDTYTYTDFVGRI